MRHDRSFYAEIRRRERRTTIFYLVLAALGGLLVLAGISAPVLNDFFGRTHRLAQAEADAYLKETRLTQGQGAIAVCVNVDSDGDGYVSCPYVTKDGITYPLECAGSMTLNTGCRPPKAVFAQPQAHPTPR